MRILIRVFLSLCLILLLGLAGLVGFLPRLIESEEMRRQVTEQARSISGHDVSFGKMELSYLPPSLRIRDGRINEGHQGGAPILEVDKVELRLSWLSLLSFAVVVDYLEIQGVVVRLVRTAQGVELFKPEERSVSREEISDRNKHDEEERDISIALRKLRVRDGRIEFKDDSVSPSAFWVLDDLQVEANGDLLKRHLDFKLNGSLGSGGRIGVEGRFGGSEKLDVRITLSDVDMIAAVPYLPRDIDILSGFLSGTVDTEDIAFEAFSFDLELTEGQLDFDDLSLRGLVRVEAELDGGFTSPKGHFEIDATAADLRYGGVFRKEIGVPATAKGRLVSSADGRLRIEDTALRITPLEGRISVDFKPDLQVRINSDPLDLGELASLFPSISDVDLAGQMHFQDFEYSSVPLTLGGVIAFDHIGIGNTGTPSLSLMGTVRGDGPRLVSDSLWLELENQRIPIQLVMDRFLDVPRYQLSLASEDLDSNSLLTVIGDHPDMIEGPLSLKADFWGPLVNDIEFFKSVAGDVQFKIAPGRIRGVSLLAHAAERLGTIGETLILAGEAKGGSGVKRLYEDSFEELSGDLQISGGKAQIQSLRLLYRDHAVEIKGAVGLADLSLDCSGKLILFDDTNGSSLDSQRILRIAHIGGTVDDPKVRINPADALDFASKSQGARKLTERIDDALGAGTGEKVLNVLDRIFGTGGTK